MRIVQELAAAVTIIYAQSVGRCELFLQTDLVPCLCHALSQTSGLPLFDDLVSFYSSFKTLL